MRMMILVLLLIALVIAGGCRPHAQESAWFTGSFEEARSAAKAHDTLLFLYFRNDSCIPCRRLDAETYSDLEVSTQLSRLVALKLDPTKNPSHQELYERYGVRFYPALIFADAEGRELERLGKFIPADEFLQLVERIRSGDTFVARLERFDRNPADPELLQSVVSTLHAHLDFAGAYARIDAFRATDHGLSPDPSAPLLYKVCRTEFNQLYGNAGRWYRDGWKELPDLHGLRAAPALEVFLESSPATLEREEQARRLRQARHEDAARLIAMRLDQDLSTNDLYLAAELAYENGHYDTAAGLFEKWYRSAGDAAIPRRLDEAAVSLYLCRTALDAALEMARAAHAATGEPDKAVTVALLLYASGAIEESIELQSRAAADSGGEEAELYALLLERMKAGEEPYPEGHPPFESYPQ